MMVKRISLKHIVIILFSLFTTFSLCSCGMEESYEDFYVEIIDDYEVKDYFVSQELDFARVENIVIAPYIHAVNHGEYAVDIIAYSQTGLEEVKVKSVSISSNENVFFDQEDEQSVVFREPQDNIVEGWARSGVFYETDVDLSDREELQVQLQVQVESGTDVSTKELNYNITIIKYMSVVWPT